MLNDMLLAHSEQVVRVVVRAADSADGSSLILLAIGAATVVGLVWLLRSKSSPQRSSSAGAQSGSRSARGRSEGHADIPDLPPSYGTSFGELLDLSGQQAVTAYRAALQRAQSDPTILPVMRAGLHWGLADALVQLDDPSVLKEALEECMRAAADVSPRMYPDIYAGIQRQYGITCLKVSISNYDKDLAQQGIQALLDALRYTRRQDEPEDWADINATLGSAYARVWDAKQANAYWDAAESVFTEREHPSEYMRIERARAGLRESIVQREKVMQDMKQKLSPQQYERFRKMAEGRRDDS